MPYWLVVAISVLWTTHFFSVVHTFYHILSLNTYQRRTYRLNLYGRLEIILFIPYTIFWWSFIIFH